MVAKRTGKLAGLAAFLAGLGWVAKDLGGRFSPDPDYWDCNSSYDYLLNTTDTAAFLLLVPALIGLYQAYRTSVGATARFAALASATGFGVAGTANLLEHCVAMSVLGFAYVIGVMVGFLLLLVFALALTRARLQPTWAVWLLVAGTAAGLLLANQGGLIMFGLAWIVVAYFLLYRQAAPKRPI